MYAISLESITALPVAPNVSSENTVEPVLKLTILNPLAEFA